MAGEPLTRRNAVQPAAGPRSGDGRVVVVGGGTPHALVRRHDVRRSRRPGAPGPCGRTSGGGPRGSPRYPSLVPPIALGKSPGRPGRTKPAPGCRPAAAGALGVAHVTTAARVYKARRTYLPQHAACIRAARNRRTAPGPALVGGPPLPRARVHRARVHHEAARSRTAARPLVVRCGARTATAPPEAVVHEIPGGRPPDRPAGSAPAGRPWRSAVVVPADRPVPNRRSRQ